MSVTREVILDLIPIYLAGEASPDTRALVESFLKEDQELAKNIRGRWVENMALAVPTSLPPDLELRAFRRARSLLVWQRWLMGFGMFFTAMLASSQLTITRGNITDFHFLARDYPALFGISAILGAASWTAYFVVRRGFRANG